MKKFIIILLLVLAGCGRPMTRKEKMLFGVMVAAQAADYETTRRCVAAGASELNPFLDDHPSRDQIALFKLATTGLFWLLGEASPDHREFLYTVGIISGGGAAIWNDNVFDGRPK
jgi:hypothetical protein